MPKEPHSAATIRAFRERLKADDEAGVRRSLAEYLELFPGDERLVALEYLSARPATPGEDEVSSITASRNGQESLGPYRLIRELGRGGQGVVWLAEDGRLRRKVALKVLTGLGVHSAETLRRFRREAEVASRLQHPGICTVYDTGLADGVPFIAMQFVEGTSLAELVAETRRAGSSMTSVAIEFSEQGAAEFDPTGSGTESLRRSSIVGEKLDEVAAIFEKAARALHAAHEVGVIHRDVKPANIMITSGNDPVLLDFGLAREMESQVPSLTLSGDVLGTPSYMSPEQVDGRSKNVDRRTDVYSLGVTLYECLTLERPFRAATRQRLYQAILQERPPAARDVNASIPRDLEVIVQTAIEKDPERRYQSAEAMAEDLRRFRCKEPITARPIGRWVRLTRWSARNPGIAAAAIFAVLSLVGGTVASLFYAGRMREERDRADEQTLEYKRLADVRKLEELRARAEQELWPPTPETAPAMRSWLMEARELARRLPEHRRALEELRTRATEVVGEEAVDVRDSAQIERIRELQELRGRAAACLAALEAMDSDDEKLFDNLGRELDAVDEALRKARAGLQRWRFEDNDEQWRHDRLAELVTGLESFVAPDPFSSTIDGVEKRLELAESVVDTTIDAHRKEWVEMRAAVAASPIYGGLELIEQPGLVPLRMNHRGFAEFLQVASGSAPERDAASGREVVTGETGIVLILLPGGTFTMGSAELDNGRRLNEEPHLVSLLPFLISKYETTQGQWIRVMGTNPSSEYPGRPNGPGGVTEANPVENVSWNDARAFCRHVGLVLPTEAQWEYSCRGGTSTAFNWGDEPACLEGRANVADRSLVETNQLPQGLPSAPWRDGWVVHAPVDWGADNAFGLHGLHGNVSEWCADVFVWEYPPGNPVPGDGLRYVAGPGRRAVRDASYVMFGDLCRSAARFGFEPDVRQKALGFRVARTLRRKR